MYHTAGKKSKGMNEFLDQALNKLAETVSYGMAGGMAPEVRRVMTDFCRQDAEFAQAVAQGGSFKDCMEAVARDIPRVGGVAALPDIEAYRRAVRFYFKGADIHFHMELDLCPECGETDRAPAQKKILDIADFL